MSNNYLVLKNSIYSNYYDITKYYVIYNNYLKKYKTTHNIRLYFTLKKYLENNDYNINTDTLFNKLKQLKLSYKEINSIPNTIKKITVDKIEKDINDILLIYSEFKKIDSAIYTLNNKGEVSINEYYDLSENTPSNILYYMYKKIYEYKNDKLLKAFTNIIDLYDKNIEIIEKESLEFASKISTKASSYFNTLKYNNYDRLYDLRHEEAYLKEYNLFNISSDESKNFYRYKLMKKIFSISYIEHNKLENLYKKGSVNLSINKKNYNFKTLIIFNNIETFDEIDEIFDKYKNENKNFLFYVKVMHDKKNYYTNMATDSNNFIEDDNLETLIKEKIKYIVVSNSKDIKISSIYKLINILEHPNNIPYKTKNGYTGIISIKFKYHKVYSYIYNFTFYNKYLKNTKLEKIKKVKYKLDDSKENYINNMTTNIMLSSKNINMLYYNKLYLFYKSKELLNDYKFIFKKDDKYIDDKSFDITIKNNIIYKTYQDEKTNINIKTTLINDSLITTVEGASEFYVFFNTEYNTVSKKNKKIIFNKETDFYTYTDAIIDDYYFNKLNVYNKKGLSINNNKYSDLVKCICYKVKCLGKANIITGLKDSILVTKNDFLNISNKEIENNTLYNKLIYYIYNPIYSNYKSSLISYNILDPNNLKKFNLDINDKYIIIDKIEEKLMEDITKFYKYIELKKINLKIVFIYNSVSREILDKYTYLYLNKSKKIIKLDKENINNKELILLYLGSIYNISKDLDEFINNLKDNEKRYKSIESFEINEKLNIKNNYGGFDSNGNLIFKDYKTLPSNKLISNDLESVTTPYYSYTTFNKKELTKKCTLYMESSEYIMINNRPLSYNSFIIKEGETIRKFKRENTEVNVTETLSVTDNIKIFKIDIKSKQNANIKLGLHLNIGNLFDRYHYTEFDKDKNIVKITNDLNIFLTCTKNIISFDDNTAICEVKLKKDETVTLAFSLGVSQLEDMWFQKEKYSNISTIDTSIKILENNINNNYNKLKIKLKNDRINTLFNLIIPYNLYINKPNNYELSLICNIFKEISLEEIKKYNIDSLYVNLIYKYIYYFQDFSLINNDLYDKLKKTIMIQNKHNFIYNESIDNFINLSKILNKKIDVNKYNKLKDKDIIVQNLYKFISSDNASFIKLFNKDQIINNYDNYIIDDSAIYYYAIERYLGIDIKGDKLEVKPLIKEDFSFTYKYSNSLYKINVKFGKKNKITYDEEIINTKYIRFKNDLKTHDINIEIKKG